MSKNKRPKPLLKWPGGKRRVLPEIRKYVPTDFDTYYEPFLGGGAVFFDLSPHAAQIGDYNSELVNFYQQVQVYPKLLIEELKENKYKNTLENYLLIRALDRDVTVFNKLTTIERAARIVYLNRTCFNGLHRVNSKDQFNVPFGKYNDPRIVDEENIKLVSDLFNKSKAIITNGDYSKITLSITTGGNFIYLDPPYIPLTVTASFASYTSIGFTLKEQEVLRDEAKRLDDLDNYVLLSNSNTLVTRELYKDFHIVSINVARSIGADSATRVSVGEVLILGKTLAENLSLT